MPCSCNIDLERGPRTAQIFFGLHFTTSLVDLKPVPQITAFLSDAHAIILPITTYTGSLNFFCLRLGFFTHIGDSPEIHFIKTGFNASPQLFSLDHRANMLNRQKSSFFKEEYRDKKPCPSRQKGPPKNSGHSYSWSEGLQKM